MRGGERFRIVGVPAIPPRVEDASAFPCLPGCCRSVPAPVTTLQRTAGVPPADARASRPRSGSVLRSPPSWNAAVPGGWPGGVLAAGRRTQARDACGPAGAALIPKGGLIQRDVFLLGACLDGEGNWFGEIPPERAAILRFKNHWDEDFVARMTAQIEALAESKRLLLVDYGGRIDRRMQRILACCNAAVIVSASAEAVAEWRGALLASGVEILAEVESVRDEAREIASRQPLRRRLGPFERGRRVENLPAELLHALHYADELERPAILGP